MADKRKRPAEEENVEALEFLSDVAGPPRRPAANTPSPKKEAKASKSPPPAAPGPPAAARPPPPPLIPALSPAQPAMPGAPPATDQGEPPYRCLHCGYPVAEGPDLRCSECGRSYDQETLEYWFSGAEQRRFEHVLWLVIAILFIKLLLLPQLLGLARVGGGLAIVAAGYLASRGKTQSTGGYFAISAMVVGAVMSLGFACVTVTLPFYTLDIVAACLLLLGMLHDPVGGVVGGVTLGRRITPIILFAAPLFALGCYALELAIGTPSPWGLPPPGTGPSLWETYSPFGFIVPYLAAVGVWIFVWRALVGIRQTLFVPRGD